MQNDSRTSPVIAMYTAEYTVNSVNGWIIDHKEAAIAGGPRYLPGINAGVYRGKS